MKHNTMILPTIHSNGTGAQTLMDDYLAARTALEAAKDAIHAIEFNARDYYTQGEGTWPQARFERNEWVRNIIMMQDDCLAVAMLAQDAIEAKEARMAKAMGVAS